MPVMFISTKQTSDFKPRNVIQSSIDHIRVKYETKQFSSILDRRSFLLRKDDYSLGLLLI